MRINLATAFSNGPR